MITAEHWSELVEWIEKRFPNKGWHAEQAVAYFNDMRDRFDMTDVWTAVLGMNEKGQRFAPNGSQLIAATIEVVHRDAVDDLYRRTPGDAKPLPESERVEWSDYAVRRFGEKLDWNEAIARIHSEMRPCNTKTCEIHYGKQKVGAE